MSRAYRIRVTDSTHRVLRAGDCVSTQLEILEVLPSAHMSELLALELQGRGYQRKGTILVRHLDGVTVTIDIATSTVTVAAEESQHVHLTSEREEDAEEDAVAEGRQTRENLRRLVQSDLDKKAAAGEAAMQTEVTDRLEAKLCDLRQELDQVSNRVTAAALKIKAAQLGRIKEITEDAQTGSLTIVLEV
jgi:FtsH ternary system-associated peptide